MTTTNNKLIVKNTVMLYIRMMFSMFVSLYTSRVVLNTLGVEDYGIYGLVGGIVVLFSFLNATMSGATSRFLTFEIGKGDIEQIKLTFCNAFIVHIGIAFIVLFFAETLGLWFLNWKLNIPDNRMFAAQIVYHLSILSSLIAITQVPYNASLIAHERMDIYAYVEMLHTTLKLLIVYVLQIGNMDKLILYAILTLSVSILVALIYRIYCIKNFQECRLNWRWNKVLGKSLFSFSSWNLYSNLCFTVRQQGTNMLLNIFGSTVVNAASGLATTVQFMIEQFSTNLVMAARPQIIKSYAVGDYISMVKLMKNTAIIANLLYLMVAIPFIIEIDDILQIWLINTPQYTTVFCIGLIIASFISLNNNILYIGIQAIGIMRVYSILAGSLSLSVIPILWLLFNNDYNLGLAYFIPILSNLGIYFVCGKLISRYVKTFNLIEYILSTMFRCIVVIIPIIILLCLIRAVFSYPIIIRILITTLISTLLLFISSYIVIIPIELRKTLKNKIKSKLYGKK